MQLSEYSSGQKYGQHASTRCRFCYTMIKQNQKGYRRLVTQAANANGQNPNTVSYGASSSSQITDDPQLSKLVQQLQMAMSDIDKLIDKSNNILYDCTQQQQGIMSFGNAMNLDQALSSLDVFSTQSEYSLDQSGTHTVQRTDPRINDFLEFTENEHSTGNGREGKVLTVTGGVGARKIESKAKVKTDEQDEQLFAKLEALDDQKLLKIVAKLAKAEKIKQNAQKKVRARLNDVQWAAVLFKVRGEEAVQKVVVLRKLIKSGRMARRIITDRLEEVSKMKAKYAASKAMTPESVRGESQLALLQHLSTADQLLEQAEEEGDSKKFRLENQIQSRLRVAAKEQSLVWVPSSQGTARRKVAATTTLLTARLKRVPTTKEVADELGWTEDRVTKSGMFQSTVPLLSKQLNKYTSALNSGRENDLEAMLGADKQEGQISELMQEEYTQAISNVLSQLPVHQQTIFTRMTGLEDGQQLAVPRIIDVLKLQKKEGSIGEGLPEKISKAWVEEQIREIQAFFSKPEIQSTLAPYLTYGTQLPNTVDGSGGMQTSYKAPSYR